MRRDERQSSLRRVTAEKIIKHSEREKSKELTADLERLISFEKFE